MKNNRRIKLIAASVALAASLQAHAGLSGLDVRSNLDEPFSGSITVTGEEAKALLGGGSVTVSEKNLTAKVRKLGDKAVITVSSAHAVREPVLVFRVGAGAQVREYTAILDPPQAIRPKPGPLLQTTARQQRRQKTKVPKPHARPAKKMPPMRRARPGRNTANRRATAKPMPSAKAKRSNRLPPPSVRNT